MVLRIKLRYPSVDSFVEKFAINTGRSGIFLATRGLQPVGTELRFELRLSDDQVVLAGVGRVAAVYEPRDDDPDAPYGMAIEFMRATRESRDLVLRMLEHRRQLGLGEPALPGPEERAAPADRTGTAAGETGPAEAVRAAAVRAAAVDEAPARAVRRPLQLSAERPRMPRTSLLELVAQLEATPSGLAEVVPALEGRAEEPVDLSRALSRARAIAGDTSEEELAALALGTETLRSTSAPPPPGASRAAAEPPPPARAISTVASHEAARSQLSILTPRRSVESLRSPSSPHEAAPAAKPPRAPEPTPVPSSPAPSAFSPGPSAASASAASPPVAPSSGMPALSPSLQHLPPPHRGAPSTLAATAAIRAEAARSHDAPPSVPSPTSGPNAPGAAGAPSTHDDASPDPEPEPRRRRVSRPERLTRPPGVFAKKNAERSAEPPAEPEPPAEAEPAVTQAASYTAGYALETIAEPALAADASLDVVIVDALDDHGAVPQTTVPAFERVLAELEDMSTGSIPLPAPQIAPPRPAPAVDPLDQLALDDLDDAEPSGRGPVLHVPSWHATVDETMPTEPVDLEETGFEILAETELGANEPHERTLDGMRPYETVVPRTVPPSGHDDGHHEPTTARSALAAAVSRPTWTRSKALDATELTPPPTSEISPTTIPGRVPTKEIDLESALDALDIEAESSVALRLPRQPDPATDPQANLGDEEEFPIELEFDD